LIIFREPNCTIITKPRSKARYKKAVEAECTKKIIFDIKKIMHFLMAQHIGNISHFEKVFPTPKLKILVLYLL